MCNIEGCGCIYPLKVICIYSFLGHFTIGKIYDAIDMENQLHVKQTKNYNLVNDGGFRESISKEHFKLLSVLRDERIDDILND